MNKEKCNNDNEPWASKILEFKTDVLKCLVCQDHKSKSPIKLQKKSFIKLVSYL